MGGGKGGRSAYDDDDLDDDYDYEEEEDYTDPYGVEQGGAYYQVTCSCFSIASLR